MFCVMAMCSETEARKIWHGLAQWLGGNGGLLHRESQLNPRESHTSPVSWTSVLGSLSPLLRNAAPDRDGWYSTSALGHLSYLLCSGRRSHLSTVDSNCFSDLPVRRLLCFAVGCTGPMSSALDGGCARRDRRRLCLGCTAICDSVAASRRSGSALSSTDCGCNGGGCRDCASTSASASLSVNTEGSGTVAFASGVAIRIAKSVSVLTVDLKGLTEDVSAWVVNVTVGTVGLKGIAHGGF